MAVCRQVDYVERFSAAGSIPRNGQRRELGPTARDMAVAHMVEAAVQPLFAPGFASRCQASPLPDTTPIARSCAVVAPAAAGYHACCSLLAKASTIVIFVVLDAFRCMAA